ncbi:MAG: RDD family protein [Wenzhouxiangellaceae bacterium]|nr:RDD family protein [Wenzhouxiangellaceae bacterium]
MSASSAQPPFHDESRPCTLPRRLAAAVYDGLIVVAIWMLGSALVVIPAGASIGPGNILFQGYLLLLAFGYFHLSWTLPGQTLGMRAWRIRLDPGPHHFGIARSAIRFSVGLVSILIFGLGFAWSLTRNDRASWHDLASGSRLIRVNGS